MDLIAQSTLVAPNASRDQLQRPTRLLAVLGFQKAGTTALRGQIVATCTAHANVNEGCPNLLLPRNWAGLHSSPLCSPRTSRMYACVDPGGVFKLPYAFGQVRRGALERFGHFYSSGLVLVMLVREPGARAYSSYSMLRSWTQGPSIVRLTKRLNFSGFVARDLARLKGTTSPGRCDWKESVVCQSAYAAAVTRLQTSFRKATHTTPRMHYFVFERMRVDPLAQLNAVLKIAGLPLQTALPAPTAFKRPTAYGPAELGLNDTLRTIRDFLKPDTERFYKMYGARIPEWSSSA